MALDTSPEAPVPVRTILRLTSEWIGRLGRVWVEGQIAELTRRGSTVFLTLRDPVAAVSVRVICPRTVLDATDPPPAEWSPGAGLGETRLQHQPGLFLPFRHRIRAVGIGELLAGWNGSAGPWPRKGCSRPNASARCRFCPARSA